MPSQRTIPLSDPQLLVVVHHTAANDAGTHIEDLIAERKRRNEGYNVIIDDEGAPHDGHARVASDVPDEQISNGVYGINWRSVNVSVDGNFEDTEPTPDEFEALVQVIAAKTKRWGWRKVDALGAPGKPSRIITHQDAGRHYSPSWYETSCPGRHMIARMPELRQRVAHYLPS